MRAGEIMDFVLCPVAPEVYVQCDEDCASCAYAEQAEREEIDVL